MQLDRTHITRAASLAFSALAPGISPKEIHFKLHLAQSAKNNNWYIPLLPLRVQEVCFEAVLPRRQRLRNRHM
jgi:hypothetical protein